MADYQSSHSGSTIDTRVSQVATNAADIAALKSRMNAAESEIDTKADATSVTAVSSRIGGVEAKIPSEATTSNKLADKAYVNSSVSGKASQSDLTNLTNRVTTVEGKIPSNASSSNQLADKSFVNSGLSTKQATLQSGTNIKTINGESILGSGNIVAGDPNAVKYVSQSLTESQKEQARANIGAASLSDMEDFNAEIVDVPSLPTVDYAYVTSSSKWSGVTGRNGSFIDVNVGDKVRIVAGNLECRYSFLTSKPTTVTAGGTPPFVTETLVNILAANETVDVTIPSGCTCLQINRFYGSDDHSPAKVEFLGALLPKIEEQIEEAVDEISRIGDNFTTFASPNLFDKTAITTGKMVNKSSGALSNSSDWVASDYIDVSGYPVGTVVGIVKTMAYSGSAGAASYNSSKQFTHGKGGAQEIVSGDAYVRFSVPASEVDTAMIYVGDAPARYYPFGTLTLLKNDSVNTEMLANKSVTDEKLSVKKRISIPLSIIGEDTTQVTSEAIYDFAVGQGYRCAILTPNVPLADTSGSNYRFQLRAYDANGDEVSTIARYSTAKPLPEYVDFVVPAGTDHIRILARCVAGVTFSVSFLPAVSASTGGILVDNPDAEFIPKFMSAKKRYYTSSETGYPTPLVMLHLSDIHGNWDNVARYLQFANHHLDNIDLLVNTGDTVVNKYTDGVTGYAALSGIEKVLNIIGNHDTRGDTWQESIGVPVYNMLIKPFVSGWSVVQPENAEANGYCYYYKDFTEKNIRVVAVDVMGYDSTEDAWLADVLDDANENELHVVILTHYSQPRPYAERTEGVFDVEPCNYSTLYPLGDDSTNLTGYNNNAYLMAETVNTFIVGGGHFVGYVQGHYHADFIAKGDKYPNQLIYSIGATKAGEMRDFDHVLNTRFQDEFQIIAIDTKNTIVKLFKVGANIDRYGRSKGGVTIDYSTGKVLGECHR